MIGSLYSTLFHNAEGGRQTHRQTDIVTYRLNQQGGLLSKPFRQKPSIGVPYFQDNCTALHCTALHCTALHCTALHCTALHCTAIHCTALHCTALHCTALHCTALHHALQCSAVQWTALQCTALHHALHCTALHFTITAVFIINLPGAYSEVLVWWRLYTTTDHNTTGQLGRTMIINQLLLSNFILKQKKITATPLKKKKNQINLFQITLTLVLHLIFWCFSKCTGFMLECRQERLFSTNSCSEDLGIKQGHHRFYN